MQIMADGVRIIHKPILLFILIITVVDLDGDLVIIVGAILTLIAVSAGILLITVVDLVGTIPIMVVDLDGDTLMDLDTEA